MRYLLAFTFIILSSAFSIADSGRELDNTGITVLKNGYIEFNHFYDDGGRHIFDQYIFWEMDDFWLDYKVIAFRMTKDTRAKLTGEEIAQLKEDNKKKYIKEWGWKKWPEDYPVPYELPLVESKKYRIYKNQDGTVRMEFTEGENKYIINATSLQESWTQYDPETLNRDRYSKNHRRELTLPINELRRQQEAKLKSQLSAPQQQLMYGFNQTLELLSTNVYKW